MKEKHVEELRLFEYWKGFDVGTALEKEMVVDWLHYRASLCDTDKLSTALLTISALIACEAHRRVK